MQKCAKGCECLRNHNCESLQDLSIWAKVQLRKLSKIHAFRTRKTLRKHDLRKSYCEILRNVYLFLAPPRSGRPRRSPASSAWSSSKSHWLLQPEIRVARQRGWACIALQVCRGRSEVPARAWGRQPIGRPYLQVSTQSSSGWTFVFVLGTQWPGFLFQVCSDFAPGSKQTLQWTDTCVSCYMGCYITWYFVIISIYKFI